MTPGRVALRVLLLLAIGAGIGSIIGAIFSGDPAYTVAWTILLPGSFVVAAIVGSRRAAKRVPAVPTTAPGILSTVQPRPVQTQAVLNPEPTAVPATGATLNGEPIRTERLGTEGLDPEVLAKMPTPRPRIPAKWGSRAIAITTVLVGVALALVPQYRTIGWTVGNIAQGRWDGNDMRTGLHQQEAVDDLADAIGSYDVVSVSFYDSYVLVDAPTTVGATTTDTYEWRYGRAGRLGPASGNIDGLFDASRIDFSIVGELVRAAMADTGWDRVDTYYPSVRANDDGVPEISIYLANDYYSASYRFTAAGELIDRYGDGLE
jgi:hypothetical protein